MEVVLCILVNVVWAVGYRKFTLLDFFGFVMGQLDASDVEE